MIGSKSQMSLFSVNYHIATDWLISTAKVNTIMESIEITILKTYESFPI